MALSRDLTVRLLADTSDLNAGMNKASGPMSKLTGTAGKLAGGFVALGAATVAVDFLGDATKAAEEDKKSQALLANQLKETNKATDEQIATVEANIDALSRASGVADDELRPAYAALARSTGDTEEANRQLAIAMDIAAGRGVPLETVTKAMEKANNGNTAALGKLGIQMKDTEGNTLSAEAAMAKAAETYKGAAAAAVTPGEKMSVAFNELKESIGTALLPVMENLSKFMVDTLLPAFEDAVAWIKEHWPEIQKAFETMWKIVEPILSTMFGFLKTQFDTISGIIDVFVKLLHGDFSGAWKAVKETIGKVWEDIKGIISNAIDAIKGFLGDAPEGIITFLKGLPGKMATAAAGMWDWLYGGFKQTLNMLIRGWNNLDFTLPSFDVGPVHFGGQTIGMPDIPLLMAKGGVVTRPTLAMIGERGPEAVIPLNRAGGMGGTFHIANLNVTANNADELVRSLNDYARRNGGLRVPGGVTAVS